MQSKEYSVGSLLKMSLFVVPRYQRPYAWEENQIDDFIKDIRRIFRRKTVNDAGYYKHFFGGIVGISSDHIEVIDGQQRLATFLMAFSLIEKALKNIAVQARVSSP